MNTALINIQYQKIGKELVVIVPLKQWEDLVALGSGTVDLQNVWCNKKIEKGLFF